MSRLGIDGQRRDFLVPENVCETLVSRYEYIVAEKEIVPDLTASIRLCDTCQKWCAP